MFLSLVFPASAQTTTRSSNEFKLDGTGNVGNKTPRPTFTAPDVTGRSKLTVDKKTGEVKQELTFKNTSATDKAAFLYCNMIEYLKKNPDGSLVKVNTTNAFNIGYDKTAKQWKCFPQAPPRVIQASPSFHFGCVEIRLDPGQTKTVTQTGQSDDFKGAEAKDFQVSYADIFNLKPVVDGVTQDASFDAASCAGAFGRNSATNFGAPPAANRRADATGFWIASNLPIKDPFVRWQELDGTLHDIEYNSLNNSLSVPSGFPAQCPDLSRTSPATVPPPVYTQALNLWDVFTMSDPETKTTQVDFVPFVGSNPYGVGVEVDPTSVAIAGGSMDQGTVFVTGGASIPEGITVPYSIAAVDPSDSNVEFWEQDGWLIQDTVPAVIDSHQVSLHDSSAFVSITATDAATSPESANFWYSLDGGQQWIVEPLDLMGDPFADTHTNTFQKSFETAAMLGQTLQYFLNVQDTALNQTWFGVGQTVVPEPSSLAGAAGLGFMALASRWRRGRN